MPKLSGIYKIENLVNGHCYIGQSCDLKRRKSNHFSELDRNCHKNGHLQNSYNKYGSKNFVFSILLLCENEEITYYEQKCVDILNPEYNIRKLCVDSNVGMIQSESARKKISEWHTGRKLSDETRRKMSESRRGEKSPWFGRLHSKSTKEKMSKNHTDCSGTKNSQFGKKFENSSSRFHGVHYSSTGRGLQKWRAQFYLNSNAWRCGRFYTEIEAALAYNEYASEYLGWKAKLNVITEEEYQKIWEE